MKLVLADMEPKCNNKRIAWYNKIFSYDTFFKK